MRLFRTRTWILLWQRYLALIDRPYRHVVEQLEEAPPDWARPTYRVVVTLILALLVFNMLDWAWRMFRKFQADRSLVEAIRLDDDGNEVFVDTLEAATHLERTTAMLKREKNYQRLGEVYASVNQPREAAKWYAKAKNHEAAAEEWAKAGETARAAKMMLKTGDYAQAAVFFTHAEEHAAAAKAHEQNGAFGDAAASWLKAKNYKKAFQAFRRYFESTQDPIPWQLEIAHGLHGVLCDPPPKLKVSEEDLDGLRRAVAERLEQGKRYDEAASLYADAGDLERAGEVYVLAGKLDKAANLLKEAGKTVEAARLGGRYYAKAGRWREAGTAFASGGDYLSAAQAFQKADDYARCAAALEKHLADKRMDNDAVEHFYILALAYEKVGKLSESRAILENIRAFAPDFRDVKDRLSNVESRINAKRDE